MWNSRQNCVWVATDQFHGQLHFLLVPDTNLFSFVRLDIEIFINMKVFVIFGLFYFSRIFILPWPKSKFPVSCELIQERRELFTLYVLFYLSKNSSQSCSFILIHRITWKQWHLTFYPLCDNLTFHISQKKLTVEPNNWIILETLLLFHQIILLPLKFELRNQTRTMMLFIK